jgi:hypothetical protein
MRNLISISLLIIYLLGNTEFGQVFNLPALLQHYEKDHTANNKVNFAAFLVMHYCTDDGTTADDGEDSKLPFKQIHQFSFIFFTAPSEQTLTTGNFYSISKRKNNRFTNQYLTDVYLKSLLQPPRFIS